MAEVRDWLIVAGGNTDLFPEGVPAQSLNDNLREMQAALRRQWNQAEWFQVGSLSGVPTITVLSGTQFRVTGGDFRAAYHAGRAIRAIGSLTGEIYGTISSSTFASGNTNVTVAWNSGNLASEGVRIELGIISAINGSLPASSNSGSLASIVAPVTKIDVIRQTGRASVAGNGSLLLTSLQYTKAGGIGRKLLIDGQVSFRTIGEEEPSFISATIGTAIRRFTGNFDSTNKTFGYSFKALFEGLASGLQTIQIHVGNQGAGAMTGIYNPITSDAAQLPAATESLFSFTEF